METNYIKHTNNAKKYQKQIDNIKAKYPEINIESKELFRDIKKLNDLFYKKNIEDIDSKGCKSDDPNDMCSDCKCWKHTRLMCS